MTARLTDEDLSRLDRYTTCDLLHSDDVKLLLTELRELRALLATPMPCGWDEPRATPDRDVYVPQDIAGWVSPDEAIALGRWTDPRRPRRARREGGEMTCPGNHRAPADPLLPLTFKTTCLHCGIQVGRAIPPQPANDDDERVKLEVRAAYLANPVTCESEFSDAEWMAYETDDEMFIMDGSRRTVWEECFDSRREQWHAGYLARVIATHEEE
jgi:hypothetical protein